MSFTEGAVIRKYRQYMERWIKTAVLAVSFFAASECAAFSVAPLGEAYIGCEVTLAVSGAETRTSGVAFEWSFKGNAQSILLRRSGLECRFVPYDTNPVTASVFAVDSSGKVVSSSDVTLTAKEFSVDIAWVETAPFMLWDASAKQDVAADGLIAGRPAQFKMELSPPYEKPFRARWDTDASTAVLDGADRPLITILRNDVGSAELSVVVTDANGLVLGRGRASVGVTVSRSKVEESERRKKAWMLWLEALERWELKDFDEAAKNARSAAETDPENPELADGAKAMLANYARVERARGFASDADIMRKDKKIVESLKTYRRSYAAWPTDAALKTIGELEEEVDKMRIMEQKLQWLRDTASSYDQENLFGDALGFYREILSFISDDAVAQRVERIENRLLSMRNAKTLIEEGRGLEAGDRVQDALNKYRESLKLESSAEIERHVKELEGVIRARRERAAALRREGAELQRKNDSARALLRYMESHALWPDADTEKRIASLSLVAEAPASRDVRSSEDFGIGTRADAERLLRSGHELYTEGKYREALDLYRKSYAIFEDGRLKNWIERVEAPLREYETVQKANSLIREGNNLYNGGLFDEAIVKYRESLIVHPNAEVENFVKRLEEATGKSSASNPVVDGR
jgi:tetratricopeptide (TPR) repeat protein